MKRTQSGSSAIEIAITMAIISLLFTLTVKGRELVENSRAESLARDFRGIQTALYGYLDRLRPLPASDSDAPTHQKVSTTVAHNGNGNLYIDDKLNAALGESYFLWQYVKLVMPLKDSANRVVAGYVPHSATGGPLGMTDIASAPISGMNSNYIICSDNISGRLIKQLDMMMDDGNTATGSMLIGRATYGGEPIPSSSIIDSDSYLACLAA